MNNVRPYTLLDTGNGQKLEQIGDIRLIRPAANAFWAPALPDSEWTAAQGTYQRNNSGSGKWSWKDRTAPESWTVSWGDLQLLVKTTNFGHIGFFAEQYENWDWLAKKVPLLGLNASVLNLFAYSGGSSLAMARAGAKVCHLDAAKGMIEWGQQNLSLNPDIAPQIRWIVDDVGKFVKREQKRQNLYQGIVLDPPSFGRGPKGQLWKVEDQLLELLDNCRSIMELNKPHFVLLSCHSPGYTPEVLARLLRQFFPKAQVEAGEMTIPEQNSENVLPAGAYARFFCG